jgi:hypothetical protein
MKRVFLIIAFSLLNQLTFGQETTRDYDLIVTIDGVVIQTLANPQIIIKRGDSVLKTMKVSYHPGDLSINEEDFNQLPDGEKSVYLKFDYSEFSLKDGNQKVHNYEIEMGKNWFDKSYMIVKIYNTCKKENKKLVPLDGKTYTFDLDYSGGQMIRVRKK